MVSYLFNNSENIDNNYLLRFITENFRLYNLESENESTLLGNLDMLVDIDKKYISILLYDETINISPIKKILKGEILWEKKRKKLMIYLKELEKLN